MPIPFSTNWVIDRSTRRRRPLEVPAADLLKAIRVSEAEVRDNWSRIEDHKWYMSERMGRDVGFAVALTDYFENVAAFDPQTRTTTRRPSSARVLLEPVFGLEAALGNFFDSIRGRHLTSL